MKTSRAFDNDGTSDEDETNDCGSSNTSNNSSKAKKKKKTPAKENGKAEPEILWSVSEAKKLLCIDIREGRVPAKATDINGKRTGVLKDIYASRPEFSLYHYSKFSSRLGSLRKAIENENESKDSSSGEDTDENHDSSAPKSTKTKKKKKKKRRAGAEPKIKWARSQAKRLLYEDIRAGRVPLSSKNADGTLSGVLEDIYASRPEFSLYHYNKFSSRLSSLRKTIKDRDNRAALDQEALDNIASNHSPSFFSHKGYIQWQYSEAQVLLKEDLEDGLHDMMSRLDLYGSRPEYHKNFPLSAFRDKVNQEIRTGKYLHTLEVRGKDTRKKKGWKV